MITEEDLFLTTISKKEKACNFFNIINLNALKQNYNLLKNKHPRGGCAAVVKANAYGLGLSNVSLALFEAGCQDFFVFSTDEGIKLRKCLPHVNIYVLNASISGLEKLYERNKLIPVLNTISDIIHLNKYCKKFNKKLDTIIQCDTGMHRGGLDKKEAIFLSLHNNFYNAINIKYIMSHLASAEDPDSALNFEQHRNFKKILHAFKKAKATLANSAGIFLGSKFHYDLLRPGASIYGLSPSPYKKVNPMLPVLNTYARIMQCHEVKAGKTVGYVNYNNKYIAFKKTRVAIVSCGYANGYPFGATNNIKNKWCYIKKWKVPILGPVSMNAMIVDITKVPETQANIGDLVELIGPNIKIDEVALQAQTITREILCRLGDGGMRFYLTY
jgi:alanine racemase